MQQPPVSLALAIVVVVVSGCGLQEHPRAGAASAIPTGFGGEPMAPIGGAGGAPAMDASSGTGGASAPPAPTGPGLMLGGAFVPKDKIHVILHFGHSNMTGLARTPSTARAFHYEPQPRLWMYMGGTTFLPSREQTAPSPGHNGAGPGHAIMRTLGGLAPPDVHLISIARGRGSATTADYQKGGLYYGPGFMNNALALKGRVTFGALWIMLGITDRHMPLPEQTGFADRLAKIVADIRADLGEPNLPVLHCDYEVESTGNLGVDSEYGRRIRPLILSLPQKVERLVIVPTDGLGMHDDHHFDLNGQREWAERGVKLMQDKGWLPWAR